MSVDSILIALAAVGLVLAAGVVMALFATDKEDGHGRK